MIKNNFLAVTLVILASSAAFAGSNEISVVSGHGDSSDGVADSEVADIATVPFIGYGDHGPNAGFELSLKDPNKATLKVTGAAKRDYTCPIIQVTRGTTEIIMSKEAQKELSASHIASSKSLNIMANCQDKQGNMVSLYLQSDLGSFTAIIRGEEKDHNLTIIGDSLSVK